MSGPEREAPDADRERIERREARAVSLRIELHAAASAGDADMIAVLIEHGASVEARMPDGRRPLHTAAQGGRSAAVKALLGAGADPEARDLNGDTVTDLARSRRDAVALRALAEARVGNGRASDYDHQAHAIRTAKELQINASARGS